MEIYGELPDRGARVREQALGDSGGGAGGGAAAAAFREVSIPLAWGGVWARDGLALRDRCLVTVAAVTALGRTEVLKMHIRGALRNSVTETELIEALLHVALYAGFPATSTALKIADEVIEEDRR